MAITLTGSGGLFTILGKLFHAQGVLNTARSTTVPDEIVDLIAALGDLSISLNAEAIGAGLEEDTLRWQSDDTLMGRLQTVAANLVVELVNSDSPQNSADLRTAMLELINQMQGSGGEANPDDTVDASAVSISVTPAAGNQSDAVVLASVIRGDGQSNQHALAETIRAAATPDGALQFLGEQSVAPQLSHQWPAGSGANLTLVPLAPGDSLLNNGGFDTETQRDNSPDDWIVEPGAVGSTVKMTNVEVQTVILSGTPTSGQYWLSFTNADSDVQTTAPLSYNASGSAVQAALRSLTGLESATVASSGTSPNFTHTITLEGVHPPGDQSLLSSDDTLDTGSIAHAQTTAGDAHVYRGKALVLDSNGSELTAVKQRLTNLQPRTAYAFNCRMKVDAFPAAGELAVEMIDGAGSVLSDVQGTVNRITIDPTSGGDLSTGSFTSIAGFFRTPATLPAVVYLRIGIRTAVSNTTSVYIDEAAFLTAETLYPGGPHIAVFAGTTALAPSDRWTLAVANDRAGAFQEYFHRNFGFTDLQLPSDAASGETIDDALIG